MRCDLDAASRAEQVGTQGAAETRARVVRNVRRDLAAFGAIREAATTAAEDFSLAASILRNRVKHLDVPADSHAGACLDLVRMGIGDDDRTRLAARCDHAASQGERIRQEVDQAVEVHSAELAASGALADFIDLLPDHGFDRDAPEIKPARTRYNAAINSHRKRQRTGE